MKEKITLTDAFNAQLGENLKVADKIVDIRNLADSLEKFCNDEVESDGVFAKVFADQMAERFAELSKLADKAVFLLVNSPLEDKFFKLQSDEEFLGERNCDHCEETFPESELANGDREDPDFLLCGDCSSDLQAKWSD